MRYDRSIVIIGASKGIGRAAAEALAAAGWVQDQVYDHANVPDRRIVATTMALLN